MHSTIMSSAIKTKNHYVENTSTLLSSSLQANDFIASKWFHTEKEKKTLDINQAVAYLDACLLGSGSITIISILISID